VGPDYSLGADRWKIGSAILSNLWRFTEDGTQGLRGQGETLKHEVRAKAAFHRQYSTTFDNTGLTEIGGCPIIEMGLSSGCVAYLARRWLGPGKSPVGRQQIWRNIMRGNDP